jgi:sigma-E factor negative regulatory protein RseB
MNYNYLILLTYLFFSTAGFADPLRDDQADWLKTMAFAAHQSNYSGTFVYQDGVGGHVDVSRITHVVDENGEHERLEKLSGERREIISSRDQVWLITNRGKVRIERRQGKRVFPALLPEQISMLKENYVIREVDEDRVAGIHVHAVLFKPKDNLRYTHKMWADSQTGLLLKAVVIDDRHRIIEQYAFTELTLGDKIDRSWVITEPSTQPVVNPRPAVAPLSIPKTSDWQIDALPSGFKMTQHFCYPMKDRNRLVTHLVYSDGLAGISVFIEDLAGRQNVNIGLSSQGVIQVYTRITGDKLITVVGEVPPNTVIQVADSIRYAGM